jgi:hypothetical protein
LSTTQKPWPCLKCMVMMNLIDEDHCKCPRCKTEVWFEYDDEPENVEELMQETYLTKLPSSNPEFSIINGPPAPGGGSKTKGNRNKKQLMQKPTTTELYKRLTGVKAPVIRRKGRPKKVVDKQDSPSV